MRASNKKGGSRRPRRGTERSNVERQPITDTEGPAISLDLEAPPRRSLATLEGLDPPICSAALCQAILEVYEPLGVTEPQRAALELMRISERIKAASQHHARQHQVRALMAQLDAAKSENNRKSIQREIDRLITVPETAGHRQAIALQASLDPVHREALLRQYQRARTKEDRQHIATKIEQIDRRMDARERELALERSAEPIPDGSDGVRSS